MIDSLYAHWLFILRTGYNLCYALDSILNGQDNAHACEESALSNLFSRKREGALGKLASRWVMSLFKCLKWPEMRGVAEELVACMHEGHGRGRFSIPVVNFARIFAPQAPPAELAKVSARGDINFTRAGSNHGTFQLAEGPRALFDLGREGLVMRVPRRMSGTYTLTAGAFHIEFNKGEELEGCKRLLMLVCNRVVSVDVSRQRVDVHLPSKLFDLCVEFE